MKSIVPACVVWFLVASSGSAYGQALSPELPGGNCKPYNDYDDVQLDDELGQIVSVATTTAEISDIFCPAPRDAVYNDITGSSTAYVRFREKSPSGVFDSTRAIQCRLVVVGTNDQGAYDQWFGSFVTATQLGEAGKSLPAPSNISSVLYITGWFVDCNMYSTDELLVYYILD